VLELPRMTAGRYSGNPLAPDQVFCALARGLMTQAAIFHRRVDSIFPQMHAVAPVYEKRAGRGCAL